MIANALKLIKEKFNEYLFVRTGNDKNRVILSNIVNQDGSLAIKGKNYVVMTLVNVEHETSISTFNRYVTTAEEKVATVSPPVNVNIYVLVSAYFEGENYEEGLKYLSHILSFFQINNYFNRQNMPGLHPGIEKITFEISSIDATALGHIISMIGAKYLPSVYYKVRMFTYQNYSIQTEVNVISGGESPTTLVNK